MDYDLESRPRLERELNLYNTVLENNTNYLKPLYFTWPLALKAEQVRPVAEALEVRKWYMRLINRTLSEYAYFYPYC